MELLYDEVLVADDSAGIFFNGQARKPEEILSAHIYENEAFDRLSSRFTKRFRNRSIGYTFFGFLTFQKQTILSASITHIV